MNDYMSLALRCGGYGKRLEEREPMNLDHVTACRFEPIEHSYDWHDAALYAISLGMGDDPLDEDELPYVYEGRDQRAVPSMSVTLGWPPLWIAEPETGIAWTKALHGEQRLTLH